MTFVSEKIGIDFTNKHYKSLAGFNGSTQYYNLNGQFINGWLYRDGKIVNKLKIINAKHRLQMGLKPEKISQNVGCPILEVNQYQTICAWGDGPERECVRTLIGTNRVFTDCTNDSSDNGDEGDGGVGGTDGDSGGNGDSPPPPVRDCAGVLNGEAYMADCGCIGGTTGKTECKKEVTIAPDARQCLKDIKAALEALGMKNTSTSSGLIASVLNKLNLSTGESFNAIVVEKTPTNPNYIAETLPPDYNNKTKSVVTEITFNPTYLNKLTDLAIAGVMMHEYIHAYFSWNLYLMERNKQVDPKFKETYDLLFNKDGQINYSPEKDSQHEQIAKSFAGEISTMLKQYAISNQIPLPSDPEYFKKMAWAGLEKTSLYKFAPSGTYTTLAAEQGISGNKITQVIKCKQ